MGSPPTSTGVTPLLFLLSVCIEMEAKKTQIQRTQAPKTHLCARSAKRWKERVEWRFWIPATAPPPLVSLSSVLCYRSRSSPLSSSPTRPREALQTERRNQGQLGGFLVHPYSILGGCQGLLKGIAAGLAEKGYRAVTFDMRGAGKSSGRASLTGFAEIKDVIAVCKWVCEHLSVDRILLVGSSAAPFWSEHGGHCAEGCWRQGPR